ncbi:MAG: hypothetical protein ACREQV_21975, partial [Candidatus Binatia bacterium]
LIHQQLVFSRQPTFYRPNYAYFRQFCFTKREFLSSPSRTAQLWRLCYASRLVLLREKPMASRLLSLTMSAFSGQD